MRYRDEHGRFRKPTDEERWPDPKEREHVRAIRALLTPPDWLIREHARMIASAVEDLGFVSGDQWSR